MDSNERYIIRYYNIPTRTTIGTITIDKETTNYVDTTVRGATRRIRKVDDFDCILKTKEEVIDFLNGRISASEENAKQATIQAQATKTFFEAIIDELSRAEGTTV